MKSLYFMRMRRALPISTLIDDLHGRHHLLARDLPALLVLLTLDTGLEPECLKTLTVYCLTNPHAGTVELRYLKRRRSEEHTSELQSLIRSSYAVFCFKKKKKRETTISKRV